MSTLIDKFIKPLKQEHLKIITRVVKAFTILNHQC